MNQSPELTAAEVRLAMRRNQWQRGTAHRFPGWLQTNLVILPQADALDFLLFCQRNPKACPVVEVTDPGNPEPRLSAPGADLRTDLARYAVFEEGELVEEVEEITRFWREDLVAFLIGSSLSFDEILLRAGVPRSTVWVLDTALPCVPAGRFSGPLVVTMRWMTPIQAVAAVQATSRLPLAHGAPVHLGNPAWIGADVKNPIDGPPVDTIPEGIMPVFWACGVTPQRVALASKIPFMITQVSGHGFITDLRIDHLSVG